jgi:small subunit ribosomal protein S19e
MSEQKKMKKRKPGITVRDVPAAAFVKAYAAHLKKSNWLKVPEWADIVKTGHFKELCPADSDWYYTRAASVARKIYLRGGTGVGALKKVYGGSYRRGPRPPIYQKGSGKIARYIVQQLCGIGVVEDLVVGAGKKKHGRKITRDGQKDLDRIAAAVSSGRAGKLDSPKFGKIPEKAKETKEAFAKLKETKETKPSKDTKKDTKGGKDTKETKPKDLKGGKQEPGKPAAKETEKGKPAAKDTEKGKPAAKDTEKGKPTPAAGKEGGQGKAAPAAKEGGQGKAAPAAKEADKGKAAPAKDTGKPAAKEAEKGKQPAAGKEADKGKQQGKQQDKAPAKSKK